MDQFIQWGGLTPDQLKERQRREWEEALMIAEAARAARNATAIGVEATGPQPTTTTTTTAAPTTTTTTSAPEDPAP